jgi:hypothetical protein
VTTIPLPVPTHELSVNGNPLTIYGTLGHTWQAIGEPDLRDGWYANAGEDGAGDCLGPFADEAQAARALGGKWSVHR